MAKYSIEDTTLKAIADAIRGKTGSSDAMLVSSMAAAISALPTAAASPQVKSITVGGEYDSTTYHGDYWAAIDANGNLLLVVEGGTSSAYESVLFEAKSLPNGVTLVNQSYTNGLSMTVGMAYVAIFSGVTASADVVLDFSAINGTSDTVTCDVTITMS